MTKDRLDPDDAREMVQRVERFLQARGYEAQVIPQAAGSLLLTYAMALLEDNGADELTMQAIEGQMRLTIELMLEHLRLYQREIVQIEQREKMS